MRVGQTVDVRGCSAYPKRELHGARDLRRRRGRLRSRTACRCGRDIDNRDGALKPEMFASFRILTSDATPSRPPCPKPRSSMRATPPMCGWPRATGSLAYRSIRTGRNNGGLVEVIEGLSRASRSCTKGGLFIDQAAASGNHMNAIVSFALRQRVLIVVLLVMVLVAGDRRAFCAQYRGVPRPGAAAGRRRDPKYRAIGRGDRALHHHPARDPDGGNPQCAGHPHDLAVRVVRRQGAIHLRFHLLPGGAVGHQPPVAARRRCRTARSRRSRLPARSARSTAIGWSGRPTIR